MTISKKRLQAIAYGSVRQSQEEGVEMARMLLEQSAEYPETLPCPVILEPGFRFGKGVNTRLMLRMLHRRAERYAEMDAMGPEARAEHDAAIAGLRETLGFGAPVKTAIKVKLPGLPQLGSDAEWYLGFAAGAGSMREACAAVIMAAGIEVEMK